MAADGFDQLVQEEALQITPVSGTFDVAAVTAALQRLDFSHAHSATPPVFLIFGDAAHRDSWIAQHARDPGAALPYVLIVHVTPAQIDMGMEIDTDVMPAARRFLEWLTASYDCRLVNSFGTDVTALAKPAA